MAKVSSIIRAMQEAAHKAGRSLIRDFGEVENLQVSQKGPGDFVSNADHKSEEIIVRELQKFRPDWDFLLEEKGEIKGDGSHRWVVDPLDGTKNFLHGVPNFCISIGLEQTLPNGKADIIAGLIFAPIQQEVYWAEKGQGAYCNDRRLQVSARKKFEHTLIGTGGLGINHPRRMQTKEAVTAVVEKGAAINMLGSAALELAYVAAGRLDAAWHMDLKPWDITAGICIVREARGMVSDVEGREKGLKQGNILSSNGLLHSNLSEILEQHYTAA